MDKYIGSPINAIHESATEQDELPDKLLAGGKHSQSMTPKSMGRGINTRSRDSKMNVRTNERSNEKLVKKQKVHKWTMEEGDEYVEHKWVNGKRKRVIKKHQTKKVKLTKEEVDEIETTFHMFDKDGSQNIDVYELKDAMKALGLNKTKA